MAIKNTEHTGSDNFNYQKYSHQLSWEDIIIRFVQKCAEHYAQASINQKDRTLFIAWVKNMKTLLINEVDKKYYDEIAKKTLILDSRYAPLKKKHDLWKKKYAYLYEIDKHYIIYEALVKVIHRAGLKQTPGVSIDLEQIEIPLPNT